MNQIFYNTSGESVSVIRFYSDYEVIGSTFTPFNGFDDEFINMFDRNSKISFYYGKGKYIINGNKIEFDLKSVVGTIKYRGTINSPKEIILSVESKINGHKSIKKYYTDDYFPEKNEQLEITSNTYPIVLIPNKILTAIMNKVSDEIIYKKLNINPPKLEKIQEPVFPEDHKYIKKKKIKYNGDGCAAIVFLQMIIFFAAVIFSSLKHENFVIAIILLVFVILFATNLGKFKTITDDKRVDLSNEEFEILKKEYFKKLNDVRNLNNDLENDYNNKKQNIELKIKNERDDIAIREYYISLQPASEAVKHNENVKRGKTEIMFLEKLLQKFGNQIRVDVSPSINSQFYFPDYVFVCNKTGLHIDIEIDEPYTFSEKLPIHYKDSTDNDRNCYFLDMNWVVIRFSEKQIIQETEKCIEVIENTIKALHNKSELIVYTLKPDNRWSYEEALVMSYNNFRNQY